MYIAKKTGFFTLSCQSRQVRLETGKEIPAGIPAGSIKRFLEIGAIEKVSEGFVQETKPSKVKKETKAKASGGEKPKADGDQSDDNKDDQGGE